MDADYLADQMELARLREENGRLEIEIAKWEENVAGLQEENERFRRERGVFLKAGLSNTDGLPADGLNMLQVGIEETVVQNARLREELRQSKAACEMQQIETVGATRELARLREENASVLRDVSDANTSLADALGERDEARTAAEYWRDQVASRRGNPLDWESGEPDPGVHLDPNQWLTGF